MQKGYEKSDPSYDFIWICDAGIRSKPETLAEMVSKIKENENVALVHQLPFVDGTGKKSAGNTLEKIYFGSQHGRIQISAHCFGQVILITMFDKFSHYRENKNDVFISMINLKS